MMWHEVIPAWLAILEANTELVGWIGTDEDGIVKIYPATASRPVVIPSMEYLIFDDIEEEIHNQIRIQVDYWIKGMAQAALVEERLRSLTHRDTARDLGGIRMWTRYLDSRTHEYPAERGIVHRSLDFEFKPVRSKYQPVFS